VIDMETQQPIAVVGMACRFPGAADIEQFWGNLAAGRESVTFFQPGEHAAGLPPELRDNPDYVAAAPLLGDADRFDAGLFGMTPREAELCDPQLRVFLEICHSALENAGYDPFAVPDSVGVFGSIGPARYQSQVLRHRPDLVSSAGMLPQTLNQPDYLATLTAYRLNLRGPAMTVLTACSSTLVAVHLACQALRLGECDSALAGGCAIRLPLERGHQWTPGGVLSADGHCRPFDAAASGTIFGSGGGAVVLKRLDDAIADGDRVAAVVLGSAVNNDGAQKASFSAPSVVGQTAVVMEAMVLAGVTPRDVGYIEAHATGTALGDPVEVAALAEAFSRLEKRPLAAGSCLLGAVKSNIGHLDEAAGIAGFIKTALIMEREAIPPTVNLDEPNPLLELEKTPFELSARLCPWRRDPGRPRVAGVTSLGIGGTNAHTVLTEGPPAVHRPSDGRPQLVVWSARNRDAADTLRGSLGRYFAASPAGRFADAAATLRRGRTAHPMRGAVVAHTAEAAAEALAGDSGTAVGTAAGEPKIAYLLPGQGTRGVRMAAGLYGTVRAFTIPMDECIELFEQQGLPLYRQWTEAAAATELIGEMLAQPLLFAVEYSLAAQWRAWGALPDAVLGHSLGELAAATVAGVFTLPEAVRLVVARAAAMAEHPVPGGMLAVAAAADELDGEITEPLVIAAVNGAKHVAISGPDAELAELAARLADRRVVCRRVPVTAAFHHPGWAPAARAWAAAFSGIEAAPPRIRVFSASAGGQADAETLGDPRFWTGQLARPVRFHEALGALLALRPDVLLEVGPGNTLTSLAARHPRRGGAACVSTLASGRDDHADEIRAAGRLWVAGAALDWDAMDFPPPMTKVAVPGYPYQRARYWADPPGAGPGPRPRAEVGSPVTEIAWLDQPRLLAAPDPRPGSALVIPPDDLDAMSTVLSALRHAGLQPVLVRPGDRYAARDGEFQARPGSLADLEQMLAALDAAGDLPQVLVHAASAGSAPPGECAADRVGGWFTSMLTLSRLALTSARWAAPPQLLLITKGAADVSGAEHPDPGSAALLGLLRTVRLESSQVPCAALDIDAGADIAALATEIASAAQAPAAGQVPVVALRGRRRWTPAERPVAVPASSRQALRDHGVYLISGGGGGLGLAIADGIARACRGPRLILLGRRDPASAVPDRLAGLRELDAHVRSYACDVTQPASLNAVLADVIAEYGPVNGVFHLAGVPGARMVAFREPADAAAVLAPKTAGTAALERALASRDGLDFVVYFSSRAAVDGLVGGGDYAAANAYLDAAAQCSPLDGVQVLSIGWPVWRGAGMAERAGIDIASLSRQAGQAAAPRTTPRSAELSWERPLSPAADWVLDEHRIGRVPLLPGTAYLDFAVQAYRDTVRGGPVPLEISDAVFRVPWLDQRERVLRVAFRPDGTGYTVEIQSRPAASDGPVVLHATARIRAVSPARATADLAWLRDRFAAVGQAIHPPRGRGLIVAGPHWQNVTSTWQAQDEKLLRVELPVPYRPELAQHALHPALLDTATAAVRGREQESSVPFRYGRLVVYRDLPAQFYAHVRIDPDAPHDTPTGDVDLIADDGTVVVSVEGFTMLLTDEARLRRQGDDGPDVTAAAAVTAAAGLDPGVGVGLLFRLLDAGMRGHVLVRPFADDRPVPVPDSTVTAPDGSPDPGGSAGTAPADPAGDLLDRLHEVWLQALGVDEVQSDQDFFDAGGNSLTAVELMARVREAFGVELSIGLLLRARTFAELADILRERGVE
jgi:acyl transferase domain-containing protein